MLMEGVRVCVGAHTPVCNM